MGSEHYRLRWSNHRANLLGVCAQLLRDEALVDVTLACQDGHSIRAHKVVLSACSSYLAALLAAHPSHPHPIVVLTHVRGAALRPLIEFMYRGEVRVRAAVLPALLDAAESLQVKGLAEMTREYLTNAASNKPDVVEPEQTEPEELVIRRPPSQPHPRGPPSPGVASSEGGSTHRSPSPPGTPQNLRICRSPAMSPGPGGRDLEPAKRPRSADSGSPAPTVVPAIGCAPSDINQLNSGHNFILGGHPPAPTATSPSACDPVPGPSSLGPAQKVPLSLKKEVDWGGDPDIKTEKESISEFSKYQHDSDVKSERSESPSTDQTRSPSTASPGRSTTPFRGLAGALVQTPFAHPAALLEVGLVHPSLFAASDELFRCSSCMAAFPSLWLLEQHSALQHIGVLPAFDKPFVCDQCGQSYRYRSAYVKHREQNHRARLPADKLFSCDVCGMQFRYLKSFKKHRLNHALERLHGGRIMIGENSQTLCRDDSPKMAEDLSMPPKVDESKEESPPPQEQGSDQVSSSNEVISVDEEVEPVVKKENFVEVEDTNMESTSSDAEQDATIDSALSLPSTNFLDSSSSLSQRSPPLGVSSAGSAEMRRFACPFCGKCVRSKENLKLHVRKHTGERPFACLFCGRAFGGKSDLTRHLRIHTGERPYHCDMCGKCFARADYLSKHLTTHINTPRS